MTRTKQAAAVAAILAATLAPIHAQRRGAPPGAAATFAVLVSDTSGAPISDVSVTASGPSQRAGRTESGRLVFEGVPAGTYRFRFDKDGYLSFEREVTTHGSAPIDVKVTLTEAPPPPKPAEPVKPPTPPPAEHTVDAKAMALDLPTYIEKNYVGRAPGKATGLSCTTGGAANLLQINEPIKEHTHADSDEFLYVMAGEGNARIGTTAEPMSPGMFLVVPRGVAHTITAGPKKPLFVLSILAGEKCES